MLKGRVEPVQRWRIYTKSDMNGFCMLVSLLASIRRPSLFQWWFFLRAGAAQHRHSAHGMLLFGLWLEWEEGREYDEDMVGRTARAWSIFCCLQCTGFGSRQPAQAAVGERSMVAPLSCLSVAAHHYTLVVLLL